MLLATLDVAAIALQNLQTLLPVLNRKVVILFIVVGLGQVFVNLNDQSVAIWQLRKPLYFLRRFVLVRDRALPVLQLHLRVAHMDQAANHIAPLLVRVALHNLQSLQIRLQRFLEIALVRVLRCLIQPMLHLAVLLRGRAHPQIIYHPQTLIHGRTPLHRATLRHPILVHGRSIAVFLPIESVRFQRNKCRPRFDIVVPLLNYLQSLVLQRILPANNAFIVFNCGLLF